eukprot:COSAG01_NODE_19061_length_1033_cov_1.860814_1_plen_208_part_00
MRRNRGSTPHRSTAVAELHQLASSKPLAFDMAVRRSPPSPKKSPVQLRLEARLNSVAAPPEPPEAGQDDDGGATRRRLALVQEKTSALARHNARCGEVAAAQRSMREQKPTADSDDGDGGDGGGGGGDDDATRRRQALVQEKTSTLARHNAHALEVAHKVGGMRASAAAMAAARLQSKLCGAQLRKKVSSSRGRAGRAATAAAVAAH